MSLLSGHFKKVFLILLLVGLHRATCISDLIPPAFRSFGGIVYDVMKDQTFCRLTECCTERFVPGDIKKLKDEMQQNLFGQHIAQEQIIAALEAHFSPRTKSRKPLVISFHGTPGTGKNFVSDKIAEALYTNGLKSKFVRKYMGRADFPVAANADVYKERINREVRESIAACPRSLFIFDEVDKMPPGVFESLTSLVDYNRYLDGNDNTQAIFIFLSNTAGVYISDILAKLISGGTLREEAQLGDFEKMIKNAAYNLDGGLKKTSLIEAHVIDHFMPFLPLEKAHVRKCIEAEFRRWKKTPDNKMISSIIDSISYERTHGLFANSGCKTLDKKVAVKIGVDRP